MIRTAANGGLAHLSDRELLHRFAGAGRLATLERHLARVRQNIALS
jgi:hypothetical protein